VRQVQAPGSDIRVPRQSLSAHHTMHDSGVPLAGTGTDDELPLATDVIWNWDGWQTAETDGWGDVLCSGCLSGWERCLGMGMGVMKQPGRTTA
jgi:hypothetical protein